MTMNDSPSQQPVAKSRAKIKVIHGPNLNLLGRREPDVYGAMTLPELDSSLLTLGGQLGVVVRTQQHNSEGALVDAIQACMDDGTRGILINPAAYTHTSVALRDALVAAALPTVEVHISNVYARESFRHHSTISDIVFARIMGFGVAGYHLALQGLAAHLRDSAS